MGITVIGVVMVGIGINLWETPYTIIPAKVGFQAFNRLGSAFGRHGFEFLESLVFFLLVYKIIILGLGAID